MFVIFVLVKQRLKREGCQCWHNLDLNLTYVLKEGKLNVSFSVECTTYTEPQCRKKCESTGRVLREFNAESTCPCKCNCSDFIHSDCKKKCQEKGKAVALSFTDQFGCSQCKCACPPYHNTSCQNQCTQEDKIHIPGAKNRFGCDICQCGCLNRDCDMECRDLEFRVTKGTLACIMGCQCICADDCDPHCDGCIPKGN